MGGQHHQKSKKQKENPDNICPDENIAGNVTFQDSLSILFCNINGLNRQKIDRINLLSTDDHIICLNETNYSENECTLLKDLEWGNYVR
jgi:hypothetical protein